MLHPLVLQAAYSGLPAGAYTPQLSGGRCREGSREVEQGEGLGVLQGGQAGCGRGVGRVTVCGLGLASPAIGLLVDA